MIKRRKRRHLTFTILSTGKKNKNNPHGNDNWSHKAGLKKKFVYHMPYDMNLNLAAVLEGIERVSNGWKQYNLLLGNAVKV